MTAFTYDHIHLRSPDAEATAPRPYSPAAAFTNFAKLLPSLGSGGRRRILSFRGAGEAREPGSYEHWPAKSGHRPVFVVSEPGPAGRPGMTASGAVRSNV